MAEQTIADRLNAPDGYSVADLWSETVAKNPDATSLIFAEDSSTMSFSDVNSASNRVAHWAVKQGLRRGDTVAIFMENRPGT